MTNNRSAVSQTVLVVDDEERIRSSLRGILSDEGFKVLETGDAPAALGMIERERPALVLLDVWMPEIDGIELLRRIKAAHPDTSVIMISGHANIQNAVAATRLGAADFIEKPFSVAGLLGAIGRVMAGDGGAPGGRTQPADGASGVRAKRAGRSPFPQRTVARSIVLAGQGLHTGFKTGVILHPAPAGHGIVFSSVADQTTVPVCLENVTRTGYNTTVSSRGHSILTIEHLMSALHAFGITNLLVRTDCEVPALDGSAIEFCRQLAEAGAEEQDAAVEPVRVSAPILVGERAPGREFIEIEPAERLIIDYTLDYPAPIGVQQVHFELASSEAYMREIAPARTFTFVSEFQKLSAMGLGSGGRLDNLILVDDDKVVNTKLRFPDEFARHKVLDLIGDLYLFGRPVLGHVTAQKTGHSDNLALLKAVQRAL